MEKFFVNIYKDQILIEVESGERSYEKFTQNELTNKEIFRHIHHFLVHVSNIMKIIQPNFKDSTDFKNYRAIYIKKEYPSLPAIDPKDIFVRNDFEHYDERIDHWVINSDKHNYVNNNIGPISAIQGIDPIDHFRHYDPQSMKLYFAQREYDLQSLYNYLQDVEKALNSKQKTKFNLKK